MADSDKQTLPAGMLAASGIVFGDIGASPLYTLKKCSTILPGGAATDAAVMGFLSLIFWGLMLIVTVKYVCFNMRAGKDWDIRKRSGETVRNMRGRPILGRVGSAL